MSDPISRDLEDKGERLARLEEHVKAMRHDFNSLRDEMKTTMSTFIGHITTLQKDYISRSEFDREMEHRDRKETERMERIGDLEDKVDDLHGRPSWSIVSVLTVSVAIIAILATIIAAYISNS